MMIFQGVDASVYQGSIDWYRVRSFHIDFAILRATTGWGKPETQTDGGFHRNMHDAAEAGLMLGAYHNSIAMNADEAHREAECFLHAIRGYQLAYPAAIDIEDRGLRYLQADQLDEVVRAWCGDILDAGYYPIIRAQLNTVANKLKPQTLKKYDLWLMRHGESIDYNGDIGMWQYTVAGSVGGVRGRIGRNRALRDYPSIMRQRGLGGLSSSAAVKQEDGIQALFSPSSPLMQAYNTLSGLAALCDVLSVFTENNGIADTISLNQAPVDIVDTSADRTPSDDSEEIIGKEPDTTINPALTETGNHDIERITDTETDEIQEEPDTADNITETDSAENRIRTADGESEAAATEAADVPELDDSIAEKLESVLDEPLIIKERNPESAAKGESPIKAKSGKLKKPENPEDSDLGDEIEERHEARMLRGRWSWFFK